MPRVGRNRRSAITGAASPCRDGTSAAATPGLVLSAEADGAFSIVSPSIDQGSGTHTILRQLVADQMKVPVDQVRVVIGDTDRAPRDGGMRASRMTYVAGNAIMQACEKLRDRLLDQAARMLECSVDEVDIR